MTDPFQGPTARLSLTEAARQLGQVATVRRLAVLHGIGGVLLVAAAIHLSRAIGVALVAAIVVALAAIVVPGTPPVARQLASVVHPDARRVGRLMSALALIAGSGVGSLYLFSIERRSGVGGSLIALVVPGLAGLMVWRATRGSIGADQDRLRAAEAEAAEVGSVIASGGRLPLLSARGIDFSYGRLQVLFGVDFTVAEGEMVALLGTNGAGKSTLLKVISGIGLPSRGTVRYRGRDITYLDAERRVPLGITQVPGGRAVFGPMDVVENLRVFGYTIGRNRREVDGLIDECFESFPRLYERRGSLAANLSGGEQQMLGLSKALILRPQLLLIDELSLGLAPIVVGQLLEMVRRINAGGTAVVLVEQSVNIALNLVDHAYFMEKGEMRFDGRSADLLDRGDLLRAVFLEGAGAATSTAKARRR